MPVLYNTTANTIADITGCCINALRCICAETVFRLFRKNIAKQKTMLCWSICFKQCQKQCLQTLFVVNMNFTQHKSAKNNSTTGLLFLQLLQEPNL